MMIAAAALGAVPAAAQLAPVPAFEAVRAVPTTAGAWIYVTSPTASESDFSGLFSIRCDRAARQVQLRRLGVAPTPGVAIPAMTIATDSVARVLAGTGASLGANDPLLDAIAFSRGRFVVMGGGGALLLLPSWPEAARSIEDCRN